MANGVSRAQIAQIIVNSPEANRLVVQTFYQMFLGRSADSAGLQFFSGALANGGSNASSSANNASASTTTATNASNSNATTNASGSSTNASASTGRLTTEQVAAGILASPEFF